MVKHVPKSRRKQDPPNCIQITFVEGCSLNCSFCGVQGIRSSRGGYKYMKYKTLQHLVTQLRMTKDTKKPWNPRIEIGVHGEPTVHPKLIRMIKLLANLDPRQLILVTNGTGLIRDTTKTIDNLFNAGVSQILLDEYDGCDFVKRILGSYKGKHEIRNYTKEMKTGFRKDSKDTDPHVLVKEDVSHLTQPYLKLNTHCGGGGPIGLENTALNKRCSKPFRELTIRWDGNVSICCNDFRGIYKIGNILDYKRIEQLWWSDEFEAAREMIYHKDRDFDPCKYCDALSPRVGLLPDKKGKLSMPYPTQTTKKILEKCVSGVPYATPVLRGWETEENNCLPELYSIADLETQPIDKKSPPKKLSLVGNKLKSKKKKLK